MIDLVTYFMVMWIAVIQTVRTKQHEWSLMNQNVQNPGRIEMGEGRIFEPFFPFQRANQHVYRVKKNVLWDTS